MTKLNNTINIPLADRPKLYTQMIQRPFDLEPLTSKSLFNYLQSEKKKGHMSLKNYSEFLNIFNTLIFFYNLVLYNISVERVDLIIFITLDATFMATSFLYYFLMKNKQNKQNTRIILVLSLCGIGVSKLLSASFRPIDTNGDSNLRHYVHLNYLLLSIPFLMSYDYYTNPLYASSTMTKLLYSILAFTLSNFTERTEMKLKVFIYGINFFEFIPEIRKCLNSYTATHNAVCYVAMLSLFEFYLGYMGRYVICLKMFLANFGVVLLYPTVFDYFYDKEKL